ncbi:hypothetical protein DCAR_0104283 [Daucus carota subsp. sativus]|uniref:Uncharacterized protein n=1 Tax=Daucus carota subsp. sativus TaxID=79200 RepID=A0A166IQ05_DAUCS|nr:hypothetical protein DCAR_0104283 [Daucus carota subsp. sativus]
MAKKGSELPKAKGDRIEGNGNTSRVHFSKSRGGISSEEFESKTKPILQYWFLLETEMYEAIMKGNLSLMPVATARVNYLKKVIPANLLGEGIRGEEDALWRIHRILRNNGWWERAGNLVISEQSQGMPTNSDPLYQFLQLHSHLVHPNTRKLVAKGVREGIRMALNQIHYGSIEEARKKKTGLSPKDDTNVARPSKFPTSVTTIPSKIMVEFISSFRHLVEPSVYRDAMRGHDKALSLALGQIHHKTLPLDSQQVHKNSYKDILNLEREGSIKMDKSEPQQNMTPPSGKEITDTIFFTGMNSSVKVIEIWQHFKKAGKIRDIILPRKRDRFGNRIGFVIAHSVSEAEKIIRSLKGSKIGSSELYVAHAKKFSSASSSRKATSRGSTFPAQSPKKGLDKPNPHVVDSNCAKSKLPPYVVPPIRLEANEDLKSELDNCLCLITAKPETVESVEFIVEGLGFRDAVIRGMSSTKFLAYFDSLALISEEDLDFLSIGFMEVRKVKDTDLIPPRKVWLEFRGLPIIGWTEQNFAQLVKNWGPVISFGQILDKVDCYCLPKLLIETDCLSTIEEEVEVEISQKKWCITIKESHADELQYEVGPSVLPDIEKDISEGDLNGEVMDNAATHNSAHLNDRIMDDIISHNPDIEGDNISEINDTSDVEVEDSLLNPLTPRPSTSSDHIPTSGTRDQINQSDHSVEKVEIFQTANWKPREKESSISMVQMQSDQDKSTSDYNPVDDLSDLCSSHPSILKDLKNLKVQSKRGRPRKPSSKHLNKHFKVPRKKKHGVSVFTLLDSSFILAKFVGGNQAAKFPAQLVG